MRCPSCNAPVRQEAVEGGAVMYCPSCGWGRDRAYRARERGIERAAPPRRPNFVLTAMAVVFAVALVIGPYGALLHYVSPVETWMHVTYWLSMITYLFFAATLNPSPDTSDLGWAGGLIDNPFSFSDDANRFSLMLAVILIPGKIACWGFAAAWAWVRGAAAA